MQQDKITIDTIKFKLLEALEGVSLLEITNDSELHGKHKAMLELDRPMPLSHLRIKITSDSFNNLSVLARHKLIQSILADEYKVIHSISLNLISKAAHEHN